MDDLRTSRDGGYGDRDGDDTIRIDEEDGTYVAHHDFETQDLTVTITLALSKIGDVSPDRVLPEFSKHVDPDALNRIFRPRPGGDRRMGGPLHLTIAGYDVTVYSTGRIEIQP